MSLQDIDLIAQDFHRRFNQHAGDLYPGVYTLDYCYELARAHNEIQASLRSKHDFIVVHNYLQPENHELVRRGSRHRIGDSLELARHVQKVVSGPSRSLEVPRISYQTVAFMAQTGKILAGDNARIFICDSLSSLGCSLVNGTDYAWLEDWKLRYPDGILVTYINSDPYTKSLSDYICTSGNTAQVILHAIKHNPGKRILVLPDKFLGFVMKAKAIELAREQNITVDPDLIEIYEHVFNGNNACCYVHEGIATDIMSAMMAEHWDDWRAGKVDFMIHPECGCASSCMLDLRRMKVPNAEQYFQSTSRMLTHSSTSTAKRFYVATEIGMLYRLRTAMPDKEFIPVSYKASCKYMKANTFPKLLRSIQTDTKEIIICNDCCDPKHPFEDFNSTHIPKSVADKARRGIELGVSIS